MGKGSKRRPKFVSNEEYALRYAYSFGEMTKDEFLTQLKEIRNVSGNGTNKENHLA